MRKRKRNGIYVMVLSVLAASMLASCSTSETTTEPPKTEPVTTAPQETPKSAEGQETPETPSSSESVSLFSEEVPPAPKTPEELFAYPTGRFAGKEFDENKDEIEAVLATFPELTDSHVNEYWDHLLYLFSEPFPHPTTVMEKWKGMNLDGPSLDPAKSMKENLNVEIVLDASGSMAQKIGGTTKMELAKQAIRTFAADLPEQANVALRVYGHKGSNADKDMKVSCNSSDLVYSLRTYDANELNKALNNFKPTGWTPIALALEGVKKDLAPYNSNENTNIVYLVSDGVETCGGNPALVAKGLAESNIAPIVNIIGFDVDSEGENSLKKIAESAKGTYATVRNQQDLMKELDKSKELAKQWNLWKIHADGNKHYVHIDFQVERQQYDLSLLKGNDRENRNLKFALEFLLANGKITKEQQEELMDFRSNRWSQLTDVRNEVSDLLKGFESEKYEELKKAIEDKYKQNSTGN